MKSDYAKINEAAFDFLAERYERISNEQAELSNLAEKCTQYLLDNFSNPSVLEIGVGSGDRIRYFSEIGFRTMAVDISSKMIEIAKIESPNTHFIHSDFLNYNFGNEKFSGVFSDSVLHLFPINKIKMFINKTYSILKNNGYFYFSIPLFDEFKEEIIRRGKKEDGILEFRTKYTLDDLTYILRKTEFDLLEKVVVGFTDSKDNNLSRLNALLIKC